MSAGPLDPARRLARLLAAWRDTHYDVALPDGSIATLRIGRPLPPSALAWLHPDPLAAFIGAANPHATPLGMEDNALRHAALRSSLRRWPCRTLPGLGHVPGAAWREDALFVAGLDLATLDAFAREFDQDGIVTATPAASARLRLYRPDWRKLLPDTDEIDWAA